MIRRWVKNVKKRKTGNHCVSMIRSKGKNVIKNVIKNVKREILVYQRFEIDFYVFTSIFQKSKKKSFSFGIFFAIWCPFETIFFIVKRKNVKT